VPGALGEQRRTPVVGEPPDADSRLVSVGVSPTREEQAAPKTATAITAASLMGCRARDRVISRRSESPVFGVATRLDVVSRRRFSEQGLRFCLLT